MTEALTELLRFGFGDLGLARLEASILPNDLPSLRLAQRLGPRPEGTAKSYMEIDGQRCDMVRWAAIPS